VRAAPAGTREAVRRPGAAVTLAYLVVTLPLFWRGAWTPRHAVFLVAHVAAAACLWWATRESARPRLIADWLPLLLVPFLYAELPRLMGNGTYRDALVRGWEVILFGTQPARTLAGAAPNAALSELLHLGYVLYYPIIYVPPLIMYVAGHMEAFRRTVLALMLTYTLCYLIFAVFPVEGPRYAWGPPAGVPGGPVRTLTLAILEGGSSRGTAFPSSHAAVAVAQAVVAFRYQRGLGVVIAVASVLLMIGAVYGGFHYAVDVLAGAPLGAAVAVAVALGLRRREGRDRLTTSVR
jgi:membrane-associated phospholipid phosphatase